MGGEGIRTLFIYVPPFILCLSIHEWAHAWAAYKLGDPTAKLSGRLTADPMAHISVMGTIVFPALGILGYLPFFGWAKPVPVDTRYFKNPRKGMALVAAAGPISNIILAILLAILFGQLGRFYVPDAEGQRNMLHAALEMTQAAIIVNLSLAVFNMLPIPPLDGSRILQAFLSRTWAHKFDQVANSGIVFFIIMMLAFRGGFGFVGYPIKFLYGLLAKFFM